MKILSLGSFGLAAFAIIGVAAQGCGGGARATADADSSGNPSGFVGNDHGGASSGSAGCATDTKRAEKHPVDMVIGLHTSFSIDFDSKWPNVRDALKAFV